jgi:pentatricopeptide repeat domain-containing protein 1
MVMFALRRQATEAFAIYKELRAAGQLLAIKETLKTGTTRISDAYGALVQCAGKAGRPELVQVLFDDMTTAGIDRPLKLYESAMKMLASKKSYKEALAVCSRLESDGHEPSPVTLSCLINFATEIGDSERAIGFFTRLAATSTPSIRACMTILRVYSKRSDWQSSVALIRDMQSRNAPIDSLMLNIVLATGVTAGKLHETTALLKEFSQKGLADVISFNTVMKGFAHGKEAGAALRMLAEMTQSGVTPNIITFNTAMDAAVRSLRVADAWGVLVHMVDAGLTPDKFTCTTLMKGLQVGATSEQLSIILDFLTGVAKERSIF